MFCFSVDQCLTTDGSKGFQLYASNIISFFYCRLYIMYPATYSVTLVGIPRYGSIGEFGFNGGKQDSVAHIGIETLYYKGLVRIGFLYLRSGTRAIDNLHIYICRIYSASRWK